jgi:hypothetical protein
MILLLFLSFYAYVMQLGDCPHLGLLPILPLQTLGIRLFFADHFFAFAGR